MELRTSFNFPSFLDEVDYSPGTATLRSRWEELTNGDFFVLSTARADDHYKGSTIGLRGFAEFSKKFEGARLIFTFWGNNAERLRKSADSLGISDRIMFVPMCGKRRLVEYLRSADCLLDQLVVGYYGATALEAAACGTPVVMRFEWAQYDALFENGAPPFLNARTVSDVVNALEFLGSNAERREDLAQQHRDWFLRSHSGQRWSADYTAILGALSLGHKFSFDESPLAAGLSAVEQAYHSEQLVAAPIFSTYEPLAPSETELELRKHIRNQSVLVNRLSAELSIRMDRVERELGDAKLQIGGMASQMQRFVEYLHKLRNMKIIDPLLRLRRRVLRGWAAFGWLTSSSVSVSRRMLHSMTNLLS